MRYCWRNFLPLEPGVRYPRCVGGARACPPEDCGGTGGYENFLAAIRDPGHEEHEEMLEWIGGEFDPEEFDLDELDIALRHIR
jgi:Plasmid pRiA4b ORF-3-like protein